MRTAVASVMPPGRTEPRHTSARATGSTASSECSNRGADRFGLHLVGIRAGVPVRAPGRELDEQRDAGCGSTCVTEGVERRRIERLRVETCSVEHELEIGAGDRVAGGRVRQSSEPYLAFAAQAEGDL